ncbi:inositol monophosphatase family protein [Streptomyces sp. NPDC021562]|uniref:inositol monophosphatase family protein n=1 Tax=Streptomyces sp. NPDC021562 TaxID=3155121 RepID=UPI0033D1D7D5
MWSTLIAVEEDGRITLGMASAPALGRRWWARADSGSWTGPCSSHSEAAAQRLALTEGKTAQNAVIGIWPPPPRLNQHERVVAMRIARAVTHVRPLLDGTAAEPIARAPRKPTTGSGTCHGALLVATGQLDAFLLLGAGPWDIAALIPIVQEAGGTFSDLSGQNRTDTGAALSARRGLHQRLLDIAVTTHLSAQSPQRLCIAVSSGYGTVPGKHFRHTPRACCESPACRATPCTLPQPSAGGDPQSTHLTPRGPPSGRTTGLSQHALERVSLIRSSVDQICPSG